MNSDPIHLELAPHVTMEFVQVPAGRFWMGNRGGEIDEEPLHLVRVPEPFWFGRYPVTQTQYHAVTGKSPSRFKDDPNEMGHVALGRPVENVTWRDAKAFCEKWNEANPGHDFLLSLPTEAQWEYGCRAGTGTDYFGGDGQEALAEVGWYGEYDLSGNAECTQPVGAKPANPFGLHDTHGNVWEWCMEIFEGEPYADCAHNRVGYSSGPVIPKGDRKMVHRGGSWYFPAMDCRSAHRDSNTPLIREDVIGFRCVLFPSVPSDRSGSDGRSPGGRRPLAPVGEPRPDCPAPGREAGAPKLPGRSGAGRPPGRTPRTGILSFQP